MPERMPDFLIIGAAKCATTWLQRALQLSPEIAMPDAELHYFSRGYARGPAWYAAQLPAPAPGQLLGEKSNSYLTDPVAAERMRDPVARAYSDYCMLLRRGETDRDVWRWLDPEHMAQERFLHDGLYAHHLSRFFSLFPQDQILLLLYEEMCSGPGSQLARLADHIGCRAQLPGPPDGRVKDRNAPLVPLPLRRLLAPARPLLDRIRHRTPLRQLRDAVARPVNHPALPPRLAARMRAFYQSDVARLEGIMGRKLQLWQEGAEDACTGSAGDRPG